MLNCCHQNIRSKKYELCFKHRRLVEWLQPITYVPQRVSRYKLKYEKLVEWLQPITYVPQWVSRYKLKLQEVFLTKKNHQKSGKTYLDDVEKMFRKLSG